MRKNFKLMNPNLESKINGEYRKVILKVFKNKCCLCGTNEKLIASRIIKDRKRPYLTYDIRNAQLLCSSCKKTTKTDVRSPHHKQSLNEKYLSILKSGASYLRSAYIRRIQRHEMKTGEVIAILTPKKEPKVIRRPKLASLPSETTFHVGSMEKIAEQNISV